MSETDEVTQEEPRLGMIVFKGFEYKADTGKYREGRLLSPMADAGNYSGWLKLDDNGDLLVRGYIGIELFGQTSRFPRLKS